MDAKIDASFDLQASRYALLSRLADDLAHEIKNPLHSMVINLEVLRRRVAAGDTEIALERAAVIEHEIERTHHVIDLLLKLVRPERVQSDQAHSLTGALEEVLPLIALQAKLARVPFRYDDIDVDAPVRAPHAAVKFTLLALTQPIIEALRPATTAVESQGFGLSVAHEDDVRIELRAPAAAVPDAAARALAGQFLQNGAGRLEASPTEGSIYLILPRFTGA